MMNGGTLPSYLFDIFQNCGKPSAFRSVRMLLKADGFMAISEVWKYPVTLLPGVPSCMLIAFAFSPTEVLFFIPSHSFKRS